jgi:hypothetical protein
MAEPFSKAVEMLASITGRVIVTGIGKSGHIGSKIAATFASTGTPAFFVHPAEANHGDLGMIAPDDAIIAMSWSGESAELKGILGYSRRFSIPLIAFTANPASTFPDSSFIHGDERSFGLVERDFENGATHRDDGRRRKDPMPVRAAAEVLNVHLDAAQEHVEQIAKSGWVFAEHDPRIGVNLERTAVGDLEFGKSVLAGDDGFTRLHLVVREQNPGRTVAEDGNLAHGAD